MSPMIPFELLFRLHTYLRSPPDSSHPTYLHLPYEMTLDALTAPNQQIPQPAPSAPPTSQKTQPNEITNNGIPSAISPSILQEAIMEDMPTPPPAPHTSPKLPMRPVDATLIPLPPSPETIRRVLPTSGDADAVPENRTYAPQVTDTPSYFTQPLSSTLYRDIQEATSSNIDLPPAPQRPAVKYIGRENPNGVRPIQNGVKPTSTSDEDFRNFLMRKSLPVAPVSSPQGPRLGNLMLSSCPGKKGLHTLSGVRWSLTC
jgi:hypothetical protein